MIPNIRYFAPTWCARFSSFLSFFVCSLRLPRLNRSHTQTPHIDWLTIVPVVWQAHTHTHTPDCLATEECNKRQTYFHRFLALFFFNLRFVSSPSINVSGKQTRTMERIKSDFVACSRREKKVAETRENSIQHANNAGKQSTTRSHMHVHIESAAIKQRLDPVEMRNCLFQNFQHQCNWCDCATTTVLQKRKEKKTKLWHNKIQANICIAGCVCVEWLDGNRQKK